jgi:hypothetical protein
MQPNTAPAVESADRPPEDLVMRCNPLQVLPIVGALWCGVGAAAAQQPPPAADGQQQIQQERAQQTPSGKTGTEEPSSHAPSPPPAPQDVFVNGALAVPGAPAESDTVPAKFSARNAADDQLITVAYTFKTLTADQRRAIYQALKDQPAGLAFNAEIGTELPLAVDLRAVPDQLIASVPQTRDYRYTVADNRVLLVSPTTRIVVGVFPDAKEIEETAGRRSP